MYRPDHKFHTRRSHRYGLYLTDDANTLYWTLDGHVMDTFDITGYFSSGPESVRDGAFLTIAAAGIFQRNVWKLDDLEIYVSKLEAAPPEEKGK